MKSIICTYMTHILTLPQTFPLSSHVLCSLQGECRDGMGVGQSAAARRQAVRIGQSDVGRSLWTPP